MNALVKPSLRGHFHQVAFFVALGAGLMLVAESRDERSFAGTLVYALSLAGLFGISALYHRPTWAPGPRAWMKRIDHAAIFILIAGTGTPLCLLAVTPEIGHRVLLLLWGAASLGILQSLFWVKAPKWVSAILYVTVGWIAAPYLPELGEGLRADIPWLVTGGVIYTVGALIYALKRPNPWPRHFGYHEIFHLLVVIAAAFHFVVIQHLVAR